MNETRNYRSGGSASGLSVWDELAKEPLLEQSDVITVERSFARRLFGGFYEHMGSLILINLAVTVQVAIGALVGLLLGSLVPGILAFVVVGLVIILFAGPAFAGLFEYTRCMLDDDERTMLSNYVGGMRAYARRSWILLGVQVATGAILVLNLRFYSQLHTGIGTVIVLLILILTVVWAMTGSYAWPLLVRGMNWRLLVRNSFFLALAAPASTLIMLVLLTALSVVLVLTAVGLAVFVFAVWAVTENVALGRLIRVFRARHEALAASEDQTLATKN